MPSRAPSPDPPRSPGGQPRGRPARVRGAVGERQQVIIEGQSVLGGSGRSCEVTPGRSASLCWGESGKKGDHEAVAWPGTLQKIAGDHRERVLFFCIIRCKARGAPTLQQGVAQLRADAEQLKYFPVSPASPATTFPSQQPTSRLSWAHCGRFFQLLVK